MALVNQKMQGDATKIQPDGLDKKKIRKKVTTKI